MPINSILPLYDVYFHNTAGTRVLLLDNFAYLEFSQKTNDSWFHQIRIEYGSDDPRIDFFRDTLTRDFLLEIYRTDAQLNTKNLVYEGLHRTIVDQINQSGVVIFTLYGTGYCNLVKRRIAIPPEGEEADVNSGPAETVIKNFIRDHFVSPVDSARIMPGLSIESDAGVGETAEYSARYTNIYTAVMRSAEQGLVDFGITKNTTVGTFLFQVRELWGTDRRIGNADGNPPTLFDVTFHNMSIPIFTLNGTNEINQVYVGGSEQGVDRQILPLGNAAAQLVSPWNRYEAFVDARSEESVDGMTTRGEAYLKEHEVKSDLTFNIVETDGTRWLRDWNLGDIVSARYGNTLFTKKIVKISVVVSAGQTGKSQIETIDVDMENV